MPENESRESQGGDGAGGGQRGAEWPLRGRDNWTAAQHLAELARYDNARDLLEPGTSIWAYDTILELVGMVRGFEAATAILRDLGPIPVTLDETDVEREVVDALLEVGPWSEIDGDGSPGSVLADHIRQLTYVSEAEG